MNHHCKQIKTWSSLVYQFLNLVETFSGQLYSKFSFGEVYIVNNISGILFILSTAKGITPLTESSNIAATTMHFVVKSSFLDCLFVNVTLRNNGGY